MSIVREIRIVLWASVPRYIVVIENTWFSSGIDERRLKLEVVHSKRWRVAPEIITQTNNAPGMVSPTNLLPFSWAQR